MHCFVIRRQAKNNNLHHRSPTLKWFNDPGSCFFHPAEWKQITTIVILILFSVNLSEIDLLRTNRKEIPRGRVKVLLFPIPSKISLAPSCPIPKFSTLGPPEANP